MLLIILIIVLIFLALGGLPVGPLGHYHSYGYGPSGILLVVVVIIVALLLLGHL